MTYSQDNERRNFDEPPVPAPRGNDRPGWIIPLGIAAVVLLAAGLIFWSAGPDRTRTVDSRNQPSAVTSPGPAPGGAPPAQGATPRRTEPSGMQ
jgi:hypothetical protein